MAIKFLNTVAVDTDVLYVDASSNNVGIGTTSPGTKLQVGTGSGATVDTAYQIVADGSAISGIQILSGATQSGRLVFGDSGNNDIGIIKYDHSDNSLQTIVNAAERMRIDSSGNVGIGTTSPQSKLQINDGSVNVTKAMQSGGVDHDFLQLSYAGSWANNIGGLASINFTDSLSSSNTVGRIGVTYTGSQGKFIVTDLYSGGYGASGDVFTIQADGETYIKGNVGIGTTSPESKLHVAGGDVLISNGQYYTAESNTGQNFQLATITTGNVVAIGAIDYTSAGTIFAGGDNVSITTGGVAGSSRLKILSNGNVGIGTTSPLQLLHVNGASDGNSIYTAMLQNTGTAPNTASKLLFVQGGSTIRGAVIGGLQEATAGSPTSMVFETSAAYATPTEKMRITSGGNVGIGTTSPNRSLHVIGQIALDNSASSPSAGMLISVDSASNKIYSRTANNNSTPLPFEIISGSSSSLYINSFGNVGIGTTSPGYKLDVAGEVRANNLFRTTDGTNIGLFGSSVFASNVIGVGSSNAVPLVLGTSATERMRITSSGNVGIGTTNPSEKLEVAGNARITGDVTLSNGNALRWTSDDVRIEGTTAGDNIKFYVANTEILQLAQSGTLATVTGNLRVTGAYYDSNNLPGTSGQVLSSTATGTDWVSLSEISGVDGTGTTNYVAKWSDTDTITDSVIYDNGANVGIGTSSPGAKLSVVGTSSITGTLTLGTTAGSNLNMSRTSANYINTTNATGYLVFRTGGFNTALTLNASQNATFAGTVAVQGTGNSYFQGNVGIGTTNPSSKLHIKQSVDSIDGGLTWESVDGTQEWSIDANNAGNFRIYKGATPIARFDSLGNFGIGTTSPGTKLDVNGAINISYSGTNLNYFGQSNSGFGYGRMYPFNSSGLFSFDTNYTFGGGYQFKYNGSEKMRINSSGNVGIGTTNPETKLDVIGEGAAIGTTGYYYNARFKDASNVGVLIGHNNVDNGNGMIAGINKLAFLTYGTSWGERMIIDGSGNVGIGTTSPTATLDINSQRGTATNLASSKTAAGFDLNSNTTGGTNSLTIGETNQTSYFLQHANSAGTTAYNLALNPYGGNVGIGTTSPNSKLEVNVGTDQNVAINSHNSVARISSYNDAFDASMPLKINGSDLRFDINSSEKMRIDSSGNVGIGTTTPSSKLQVAGGVQMADDTDAASVDKVGTLRYRTSGNNSYVDMCMQTGATTYEWVNIVQNNW